MPIQPCSSGGRTGRRWGSKGRCYVGKGASAKAGRQAEAAYANGYRGHAERRKPKVRRFSEGSRVRDAEIFCSGEFRGKKYTPADLHDIARNFKQFSTGRKPGFSVPAVLGHEEDQDFLERSDLPAAAWASRVWVEKAPLPGQPDRHVLKADFDDVAPKIAKLIRGKRYRTISSEIYDDPPSGIPGKGKMLRRVAFLGADQPEVKSIADIPMPEEHSESRTFARYRACQLKLARVSARPLAGAYVCFSEVSPMSREELLKRLQEEGYDTSVLGDDVSEEALAEILRVLEDRSSQEGDSDAAGDTEPVEEHDEEDGDGDHDHDDYDDPTAEGKPSNTVDDLELHDEEDGDGEHESYDDEPPEAKDEDEKKQLAAKFRAMKRYAERGLKKYCDDKGPQPMGKFSEKQLATVVNRAVEKALAAKVGEKLKRFESFTEKQLASQKKATVKAFCEEMVKAGKVLPAELDRKANKANLYDRLMRADATPVHKFSEKGKTVKLSELDLQMQEIRNRPAFKFGERVQTGKGGKAGAVEADCEAVISAHYERFSEDYKKNGISREKLIEDYKSLNAENKAAMLAEYRRLEQPA